MKIVRIHLETMKKKQMKITKLKNTTYEIKRDWQHIEKNRRINKLEDRLTKIIQTEAQKDNKSIKLESQ